MTAISWNFGTVRVDYYPANCCTVTTFTDGARLCAAPQEADGYRQTAERLGYGADTAAMSREHELAHSFLASKMNLPHSPTLWAVAHGGNEAADISIARQWEEEALVMAFQAFLNDPETIEPALTRLCEWGDLNALRQEFLLVRKGWGEPRFLNSLTRNGDPK